MLDEEDYMEAQETKVEDFVSLWLSPCPHYYADVSGADIAILC